MDHNAEYARYMMAGTRLGQKSADGTVVFVGASGVGKTSLIYSAIHDRQIAAAIDVFAPTDQEDHYTKFNQGARINIVDTGGRPELFPLASEQLAACSVAVMVFDVSRPETIEALQIYADTLSSYEHQSAVPVILVANKMDLVQEPRDWQRRLDRQYSWTLEMIQGRTERCYLVETQCKQLGAHKTIMQLRDLIARELPLMPQLVVNNKAASRKSGSGASQNLCMSTTSTPFSDSPRTPSSTPTTPKSRGESPRVLSSGDDIIDQDLGYDFSGVSLQPPITRPATGKPPGRRHSQGAMLSTSTSASASASGSPRSQAPSPTTSPREHEQKCSVQ